MEKIRPRDCDCCQVSALLSVAPTGRLLYYCKVASVREVGSKSLFEMRGGRPVLNPLSDIFRGLSQPHPSPPPPSSSPHQLFFNSVFTVSRFFHQPLNRAAFISQFFLLYSRRRPKNPALYRSYFISLIT